MKGIRMRITLGCLAGLIAAVAVGGGSAGNRTGEAHFTVVPGPGRVTYGENIAYRATFSNTGGSNFTHVAFRMDVPHVASPYTEATLPTSTCPSVATIEATSDGPEWVCRFGTLGPGADEVLTIVWTVPTLPSSSGCDTSCLVTNGRWTVKEGVNDTSDPNDAFLAPENPVKATLLGAGAGTTETLEAGGYETTPCSNAFGDGSLRTHKTISLANPVSTTICVPSIVLTTDDDLGHAATILERNGDPRHSEVCVAALGVNCGAHGTYDEASFGSPYVTHVFRVADAALPKGYKITAVSHNGDPALTAGTCSATPGECVVSIVLDRKTKIWTIVATSPTNGLWDW